MSVGNGRERKEFGLLQSKQLGSGVHVEKILHGKLARNFLTSLLLSTGASAPALSTGRPVTGSAMILPL